MIEVWGLRLHGYGLMVGLGILAAAYVSGWLAQKRGYGKKLVDQGLWWVIIPGIIGARVYHVIDYWWYYSQNWGEIVKVWNGGLGIWGGIIGGGVGIVMSALGGHLHWNKQEGRFRVKPGMTWRDLFDISAIGVPLGQAIGRVGNALNGEIVGKHGEPLWAIEAGLNLVLFALLLRVSGKPGRVASVYLIGYGVIRICLEWLRPDGQIWHLAGLPVAVWVGAAAAGLGGVMLGHRLD